MSNVTYLNLEAKPYTNEQKDECKKVLLQLVDEIKSKIESGEIDAIAWVEFNSYKRTMIPNWMGLYEIAHMLCGAEVLKNAIFDTELRNQ